MTRPTALSTTTTATASATGSVVFVIDDGVDGSEGYFGTPGLPPPLHHPVSTVVLTQLPQQRQPWTNHLGVWQ